MIGNDLVVAYTIPDNSGKKEFITILSWGDEITVTKNTKKYYFIEFNFSKELDDGSFILEEKSGVINRKTKLIDVDTNGILRIDFVDVQQGDAAYIETPNNKRMLVDGGDNQLFARYLAQKLPGSTIDDPYEIDAIVATHGDADHFQGLIEIFNSEKNDVENKQLFIYPKRIFHNGIVKSSDKINKKTVSTKKRLGETKKFGNKLYLVDLFDDLTKVDKKRLNSTFQKWVKAIKEYQKRGPIELRRLEYDPLDKPFDFVKEEDIDIQVLGPKTEIKGNQRVLPFLKSRGKPIPRSVIKNDDEDEEKGSYSHSHTINGHSIILKVKFKNVNILFTGDLNDESGKDLAHLAEKEGINLGAEIFKTPHHGSHEFSSEFLRKVKPVVSIISSGDENAAKEYIHPRASLVGALGKNSRVAEPLIFVTELAAFFKNMGFVDDKIHKTSKLKTRKKTKQKGPFYAFKRTAFGTVHIRTNGQRVLVYTHSGKEDMKESYVFTVDNKGKIVFKPEKIVTS